MISRKGSLGQKAGPGIATWAPMVSVVATTEKEPGRVDGKEKKEMEVWLSAWDFPD